MRPSYSDLSSGKTRARGSAWGLWGDDDEVGALNDVTPAQVTGAASLVRQGAVFSLNWDLAADGRYTGLLTSAPLNVRGGAGSTANALALK